ncbi:MAG: XRE family transcriptional regulator [Cytophagales bacterium]|nr:MAG: XRE family transcriptional regulator [Cytophagales bacterium]
MKYLRDQDGLNQFGARLRQLRQQKGFTQEELAAKMDMEFSQIGRVERGRVNSSLSMVFALAKALEVDIRELFNFSEIDSE